MVLLSCIVLIKKLWELVNFLAESLLHVENKENRALKVKNKLRVYIYTYMKIHCFPGYRLTQWK